MCMANGMAFALIFLVMVMFKRFGLNNATITFNLSLVCLPWVARPLCHLLVRRTAPDKGVWMLACEAIFAVATVVMAATLYTGYWFQWTMLMLHPGLLHLRLSCRTWSPSHHPHGRRSPYLCETA